MSYYIKQIENNKYNHYKYHYLDHMTCVIDVRDNYWSFAMDLYDINNFKLPVDSLAGNLQLPYQTIQDITFNLNSDQTHAKDQVEYNRDYAHLYSTVFNIDVSQNELFKQDLENFKLNFQLSLFIDPEAAKAAGTDLKQDDLDALVNETSEQRWNFETYYTNTHIIEQNATINNITGYSLVFGHECLPTTRAIDVSCLHLDNLTQSFNELVSLQCTTAFQVLSAKVKFIYWLELETESKTLEKTLDIDRRSTNQTTICLNDNTYFDFENNKVIFDPLGVKGFNIPRFAHGYYEVELLLSQEETVNKLIIKNNFNFIENQTKPYVFVCEKTINSLEGFKEVIFNDENV